MALPSWAFQLENYDHPPHDDLICSICQMVFCEPMECPCKHVFCYECIKKWVNMHQNCPICREVTFEASLRFVNRIIRNLIFSMRIKCVNSALGCDAVFTVEESAAHVNVCPYELVQCPNECGKKFFRKELQDHQSEKCPCRKCKSCNLIIGTDEKEHNCVESMRLTLDSLVKTNVVLQEKVEQMGASLERLRHFVFYIWADYSTRRLVSPLNRNGAGYGTSQEEYRRPTMSPELVTTSPTVTPAASPTTPPARSLVQSSPARSLVQSPPPLPLPLPASSPPASPPVLSPPVVSPAAELLSPSMSTYYFSNPSSDTSSSVDLTERNTAGSSNQEDGFNNPQFSFTVGSMLPSTSYDDAEVSFSASVYNNAPGSENSINEASTSQQANQMKHTRSDSSVVQLDDDDDDTDDDDNQFGSAAKIPRYSTTGNSMPVFDVLPGCSNDFFPQARSQAPTAGKSRYELPLLPPTNFFTLFPATSNDGQASGSASSSRQDQSKYTIAWLQDHIAELKSEEALLNANNNSSTYRDTSSGEIVLSSDDEDSSSTKG